MPIESPRGPLAVAVVGATGLVGRTMIQILAERDFPVRELRPLASRADGRSVEFGGRSAFLDELYVKPSSRGRGVGSIALRLLQSACRKMGARSLALEVHLENARAEALYRREGFASNGRLLMTRRL